MDSVILSSRSTAVHLFLPLKVWRGNDKTRPLIPILSVED